MDEPVNIDMDPEDALRLLLSRQLVGDQVELEDENAESE
jgi:hypothetical protein